MDIDLNDKYTLNKGVRFLTGSQALVRLSIIQKRRDFERWGHRLTDCGTGRCYHVRCNFCNF